MAKEKKPATEVGKLIKAHSKKKVANEVTVGKRIKTRKPQPKPKGEPKSVLGLIAKYASEKHRK